MRIIFSVLLVLVACCIQSCKEGCRDKTAINYDSKAAEENGTCLYCKEAFSADSATYRFTSPNSPDPNVFSIAFIVTATNSSILGNGCQTQGKTVSSSCKNYLRMVNLTNKNVDGSFNVEFIQNGNLAWFFQDNTFIQMGPPGSGMDTLDFGLVDSVACSNLATGTMSPSLFNLQFF